MGDWYCEWLQENKKPTGDVPPPWHFMDCHPFRIHWRMGAGEDYLDGWHRWWSESCFSTAERISYFKRWTISPAWLPFVARSIWECDYWYRLNEDEKSEIITKLHAAGIASEAPHSNKSTASQRTFEIVLLFGEFPPPWYFLDEGPEHPAWRLLGGMTLLEDWQQWWRNRNLDKDERIRYFKRWPLQSWWLDFAIGKIWSPNIVYENRKLRYAS